MRYSILYAPIADVFEHDEDGVWRFVLGLVVVLAGIATFTLGGRLSYPQLHPMNRLEDVRVSKVVSSRGGVLRRESLALVLETGHIPDLLGRGSWLEDPGSRRSRAVLATLRPGDRVNIVYDTFTDRVWHVERPDGAGTVVLLTPDSVAKWMPAERAAAKRSSFWLLVPGLSLMMWFVIDHLPRRRQEVVAEESDSPAT